MDDIYALCERMQKAGVTINRPPRDGRMAFVRSPDGISIELIQKGQALPKRSPGRRWAIPGRLVIAHAIATAPAAARL